MKKFELNCYKDFKCLAKNCKHTCCAGWEIDVDKKTLSKYKKIPELHNGIDFEKGCFILNENGRCPFLDDNNLCKIISKYGEHALCQVCADHPRFRNFFSDRVETGLGLTCEQAVNVILSQKERLYFVQTAKGLFNKRLNGFEKAVLNFREKLISIIQNRKTSLEKRINEMSLLCNFVPPDFIKLQNFLSSLEILNPEWENTILKLTVTPKKQAEFKVEYENLISYFLYRHVSKAEDQTDLITRTKFCLLSFSVIKRLCDAKETENRCKKNDLFDFCRQYSTEIEYCDDNLYALLDYLEK